VATLARLAAAIGFTTLSLAAIYGVLTMTAVLMWKLQKRPSKSRSMPPITVLKPLCGSEPGLYEHLRSFCVQDYPEFQIVFGVRDPGDPACAVVTRLAAEFPSVPIELVIDPQLHGSNCKVSNLINMLPHARHELLIMSDSDAFAAPDCLSTVSAPLLDAGVGLVTCIYHGSPTPPVWSRLGAMYINEWYIPSVLLAWLFGHQGYVSGQVMGLRRDTLASVGGLQTLADHLADDYRMGELVRKRGLKIVLSRYVVQGEHHEPDFDSLIRHELRWLRTIRTLRPRSFRLLFLSFTLPLALCGMAATAIAFDSWPPRAAWVLLSVTLLARVALHWANRVRGGRSPLWDLWLVPVRDFLLLGVWCRSFFTSHVTWRGIEFDTDSNGVMHPLR
jgi:ceramide glucosyltransferase